MRNNTTFHGPLSRVLFVGGLTASLVLTGCAGQFSGSGGDEQSGEGLPLGATKEEYIAAFEDIDPIRVAIPETALEDTITAAKSQWYAEAVEEWSGGKITVEVGYGGSMASAPEVEGALSDDRVQAGLFYPSMNPAAFPTLTTIQGISNQTRVTSVVGLLQGIGAMNEALWASEDAISDIEAAGIVPILPGMTQSPAQGFMCKSGPITSLDDASGRLVRTPSAPVTAQLEVLGITPVSVTTAELYEGIQRGTVDCNVASIYGNAVIKIPEVAPYFSTSEEISTIATVGSLGISQLAWDELPLVAKQLLWDKGDAFIEGYVAGLIESDINGIDSIRASGGEISKWDEDVVMALEDQRAGVIAATDPEIADSYSAAVRNWEQIVTEELGYSDGGSLADLPEWYGDGSDYDFSVFADYLMTEVLSAYRPS